MEPLSCLYFYKYRINLNAKELIHLPYYKGSALRGVFGYALKRVVCVIKKTTCDDCMLRFKCIYSTVMETPIPEGHPDYRKYKNAPHPYVIIPPLTDRRDLKPDDLLSFNIILIGMANEYLPYFIYTFVEMGRIGIGKERGRFSVESVESLNLDGMTEEVFSGYDKALRASDTRIDYGLFENDEFRGDEITITFETPVRLKVRDKLSSHIPFHLLIRRLSERAFLLAHLHCGAEMGDFEGFAKGSEKVETISSNLQWIDWERYSNKQQTRMKFGGWIGDITYKGDFQKYLPLLRVGEYIHVGKAATFGLGKYRIK